jgi:hypothetical protein
MDDTLGFSYASTSQVNVWKSQSYCLLIFICVHLRSFADLLFFFITVTGDCGDTPAIS